MNQKAVVVFSGGQDSTTCLFWALERFDEVIAVTFDYGQKNKLEIECASKIAKELGVEHHILDMGLLNQLAPNALTREEIPVEAGNGRRSAFHVRGGTEPPLFQLCGSAGQGERVPPYCGWGIPNRF